MLLASLAFASALSMSPQQQAAPQDPIAIPDVEVEVRARAHADRAREFVGRIAAPARNRGLARWESVCPQVVNLERAAAQEIANRIAEVANELDIPVEAPGCRANVVVVFASDVGQIVDSMAEAYPRVYRANHGALSRGGAAFRDFREVDRPVRWWNVSAPYHAETGTLAVRIPGDRSGAVVAADIASSLGCDPNDCIIGAAPIIPRLNGRLDSPIEERMLTTIIYVDIDEVEGVNTAQLSDYLALVSLAQVDMNADTGAFDTVLNLFDNRDGVVGLTSWDEAYLRGLYGARSSRQSVSAQKGAVASLMYRISREQE